MRRGCDVWCGAIPDGRCEPARDIAKVPQGAVRAQRGYRLVTTHTVDQPATTFCPSCRRSRSLDHRYRGAHWTTCTGVALDVVVPLPSWPYRLSPQQYAAPVGVTPHVSWVPALRELKVRPPPTATGWGSLTVLPSPSSPHVLVPQQYAAPLLVSAQV